MIFKKQKLTIKIFL